MIGFIKKFILPREVDFHAALDNQAVIVRNIVQKLYQSCIDSDTRAFNEIRKDYDEQRDLKVANMKELLDVFITPYDKESIYRLIVQLDWIALSIQHFMTEIEAYGIEDLQDNKPIFTLLLTMVELLEHSIRHLPDRKLQIISENVELIHDQYNDVVGLCASGAARQMQQDDVKLIIVQKDILTQLRQIAKRMHITANTLEDMAIKVS
jgi:hypothetical protein